MPEPKLVSLKLSEDERKEQSGPMVMDDDGPAYPVDARLFFDGDMLDKLGVDMPKFGDEMMLVAKVKATSVSASERMDDDGDANRDRSVQFVMTEAALDSGPKKSAAEVLYPGMKKDE